MGRRTPADPDTRIWGVDATFTAAGQTSDFCTIRQPTWFAIVGGTFTSAAISLEVSFDGASWVPYCGAPNEPLVLFALGAMLIPGGCEAGVRMRLRCDALTGTSVAVRLSGGGNP